MMDTLAKKTRLSSEKECTLNTICDWSRSENTAIEYHDSKSIRRINYAELQDTKKEIESALLRIKSSGFIGINYNIKTFCVPALILGIQSQGCGFINLSSMNSTEICLMLEIRFIFSKCIIPDTKLVCELNIHGETVKLLECQSMAIAENNSINENKFAYAITTSGSTGEPKIVKVPHACIVPNILDLKKILDLSSADKIAQITALTFDPSIVEIFLSLTSGGTLFVVSNNIMNSPHELLRLIFEHKVTFLQTTPSLWRYRWSANEIENTIFSKESLLKALLIGGEPFPQIDTLRAIKQFENKTKIFNVYGITEVSCWASISEVNLANSNELNVPAEQNLGKTLSQTIFQVRNQTGDIIYNGEGILYIGSNSRVCVINNEDPTCSETPVFRKTGDLVMGRCYLMMKQVAAPGARPGWVPKSMIINFLSSIVKTFYGWTRGHRDEILLHHENGLGQINGDNLFYKDRCDRTIKRFGNRIDLNELEAVVLKLSFVENCIALWDEKSHKLYLCIAYINPKKMNHKFINDLRAQEELKKQLQRLPFVYQPDRIKYLNNFRLTASGKICKRALMKIFQNTEKRYFETDKSILDTEVVRERLTQIWKNHLTLTTRSGFLENGGTSIIAMQISNYITAAFDKEFPELIGLLLKNGTLTNCIDYVVKKINCPHREIETNDATSSPRAMLVGSHKKVKHNFSYPDEDSESNICVWQISRGKVTAAITRTDSFQVSVKSTLSVEYTRNLKKCVDASPTVFRYSSSEIYTSVGSHAGVILTEQLYPGGSNTYEINLPDRIEASIFVLNEFNGIIGCYDGYVYCLNLKTGQIIWKFKTGDTVKCTAVLSSDGKSVFVGSYDKYLYSISVKDGSEMWKLKGSEGSVSATPRTYARWHSVVFGTLDGTCVSLNQTSGQIIWKNKLQDPIFSAPGVLESGDIIFCSVSGEVTCFNLETGCKTWKYKIDGNVFSHLVVKKNFTTNTENVFIGCNNRNVYCLAVETNSSSPVLIYSVTFQSPIFATPYCEGDVLVVAETSGNINLLNAHDGKIFNSLKLNGEIFSSPVIAGEFLVVGCRDNKMYVIRINK